MTSPAEALEAENLRLRQRLSAAQQGLQDMVYIVSHDLGAPLRAVTGFSGILQQKYAHRLDDKGRDYLNFIAEGGQKAQRMLAGLLEYSRVETQACEPGPVDLAATVAAAWGGLALRAADMQAQMDAAPLPEIEASPAQMQRLFFLLLENSLQYARPGVPPRISLTCESRQDRVCLSLCDNGCGIPEDKRELAFQPFRQLQRDDGATGVGMGLAIARRIVERHGGSISLAAAQPHGLCCRIVLPKKMQGRRA